MADEQKIVEALSPIERVVFPLVGKDAVDVDGLCKSADVDRTTVVRALEFLKKKKLVEVKEEAKKVVIAGINGIYYLKKGLPERRLLLELLKRKFILISDIKKVGLNDNEAKIAVGVLKKKAVVSITRGRILLTARKEEITKKMLEEQFLESLPRDVDKLEGQEKLALQNLRSRKDIVEVKDEKKISVKLTALGEKISKMDLNVNLIEQLTPKIIKSSGWKGKKFRRFDVVSGVPRIYGGKRHFVNQAIDYGKKVWLEMGFKEMTGDLTTTGFWNFDALFTAQDHPVREMHDTFFIKDLNGKLPEDRKLIEQIKKAHEGGGVMAGGVSKGWQSKWSEEESKKVLLRTHTTLLSARTLKKLSEDVENNIPAKYFAMGMNFRNETVDWSHGFELLQTEGIVIDENATFRQLLGYLKEFFKKMGYEKIRIRPGYFPYTEPSLEIDFWYEEKKVWLELGGAGMFRPEVVVPIFGKHIPVLAWGPGFGRILMKYYDIKDLRELNENDLNKLRGMKFWV